jgi:glyoxylase-like metal-dependent hydrolase (beta-lactamase superfamily II)
MMLHSVLSNGYKLDGGAMFGNAPRALWEKWLVPDERNRIYLATRAFLAVTASSTILIEAGIGAYMEPKYRDRYCVEGTEHILLQSLERLGFAHTDITHVILSHLHFDHVGGLLSAWREGADPELLFPNATFYTGEAAWDRALHPHSRDRASFVPGLNRELEQSGRLTLLKKEDRIKVDELEIQFFASDGHTPGLLCADLRWEGNRAVFASDLIPGRAWLHLPITMGYDRYPELLINEKDEVLHSIVQDDAWLCYVHDPEIAISKVKIDPEQRTFVAVDARPICLL